MSYLAYLNACKTCCHTASLVEYKTLDQNILPYEVYSSSRSFEDTRIVFFSWMQICFLLNYR